jgi:hypothetical protein
MTRALLSLFLLALALAAPALAQVPPFVHGGTIGTSPITVLQEDSLRKKIIFFNGNAAGNLAFCPVGPDRDTNAAIVCAVNGADAITLAPGWTFVVTNAASPASPPLPIGTAWYGVGSTSGLTYTILDFE